jgi:cysteine synthase A
VLDVALIDQVIEVSDEEAFLTTRELARSNSLLVGTSAGANVFAARELARRNPGMNIVTVFPDRAERYFSTALFSPEEERQDAFSARQQS